MNAYSRRGFVLSTAAASAGLGLVSVPSSAASSVSVANFAAIDDSIMTTDGTIDAVWIRSELGIAWEGATSGAEVDLSVTVKNAVSEEEETILSLTESLDSTHGSRSFSFESLDLLALDTFEHADFEVTEPGTSEVVFVEFEITAAISANGAILVTQTESAVSEIRIERLPAPEISKFELTDDSNPAWTRVTVDWAVTDDTFELEEITSELLFNEAVVATQSTNANGSSESGTHELEVQEASEDEYHVRLRTTNIEGGVFEEERSETGDYHTYQPVELFEELTAEVTDTQNRGGIVEPHQVTVEFERHLGESLDIAFIVQVGNSSTTIEDVGSSGSVVIDIDGSGQPSQEANVIVAADGEDIIAEIITTADGVVDLLESEY